MDTLNNIDAWNNDPSTSFNEVLDDGSSEDDATWGLVNLIGLALFLAAVIGPIAYVTFCCRRPVTGERCLCGKYWLKLMTCLWLKHHLTNRATASNSINRSHNDEDTQQQPRRNSYDPPIYNMALAMPRLEEKIPATPPPKYDHLLITDTLPSMDGSMEPAQCQLRLDASQLASYQSVNKHDHYSPRPIMDNLPTYEESLLMLKTKQNSELEV